MSTLERAIAIAAEAHAGQTDKGHAPYILHPLRVMLAMSCQLDRTVAVLHDVLEDCPEWTVTRLRAEGFGPLITDALEALTRRKGEDYEDFIDRVKLNSIAARVKLADLADNRDLSRLPKITETDRRRLEKYDRATFALRH